MDTPHCRIHRELPLDNVETVTMPPVNLEGLSPSGKGQPVQFAQPIPVEISPSTNGSWQNLADDVLLWRLRIVSPGAVSLNLGFTSYFMPAGGCLFLYPPDGSTVIGPFTDRDNEEHRQLWTPAVMGDELVLELVLSRKALPQLELGLTSVNHGFK